jgi:solute carrier family 25 phosphate transporter 23/24/25/41
MWREEGFAGFMKGNGINVVRVSEAVEFVWADRSDVDADVQDLAIFCHPVHSELSSYNKSIYASQESKLISQSYGYVKTLLARWSGQETLSTPFRLAAGATAGILAVCEWSGSPVLIESRLIVPAATYPLDLVRARLSIATANMSRSSGSMFTAEDAKLGIMGMTKKVYRTEGGIRGL